MSKNNVVGKVPFNVKAVQMAKNLPRWNTPSPGKKLTLREWLFYIIGASGLLAAIPYLFWDLTEKRHKEMMEVLRIRAMHDDGDLDDDTFERLQAEAEAGNANALTEYLKIMNVEDSLSDDETDITREFSDIYDNLDIDIDTTSTVDGPEVVPGMENAEFTDYNISEQDIKDNGDDKTE